MKDKQRSTSQVKDKHTPDPYDYDPRAPWNEDEREPLGYLEEADYHEEHNDD